jgi:hypothetical protein
LLPLVRYFLFTGAVLIGLLFFSDWYFPKPTTKAASADIDRSIIRIQSSRKRPAAVQIDTGVQMPRVTLQIAVGGELPVSRATSVRKAHAYFPPPAQRALDKSHRRAKPVSRLSARGTRRRVACQPNWFPAAW